MTRAKKVKSIREMTKILSSRETYKRIANISFPLSRFLKGVRAGNFGEFLKFIPDRTLAEKLPDNFLARNMSWETCL